MKTIDIEKFKGFKISIEDKKVTDKYSGKTRDYLVANSPHSDRPGRKTPYSQGWIVTNHVFSDGYAAVVWNETNWQLTHLLENGHFVKNHKGTLKEYWSAPRKHIYPAYLKYRDGYIRDMKKVKIKADFK